MSTARYIVGDSLAVLRSLPDASVDLVLSSPPFLALRSYLPADHPDKALEMGSEATPGEFIDSLLTITEECRRVLAPHGSLCFELGDTYAGSGGAGGDYGPNGLREGQQRFDGSASKAYGPGAAPARVRRTTVSRRRDQAEVPRNLSGGVGWPLDKSLCLIPELFRFALVYGFNPLSPCRACAGSGMRHTRATQVPVVGSLARYEGPCVACGGLGRRTTPRWRVRNVVRWCLDGDTVVYARTPKGVGPARLLHLAQNWREGQWQLWDGSRWAKVLGWSSTTADDAIEIEFRNGEKVSATREHQWPTERGLLRTDQLTVGDVVPTVRLPDAGSKSPTHLPDDDIGWLVGVFLADGSFDDRDRIQIAGHRDESELRRERLAKIATAYDGTCTAYAVGDGNEGLVVVRSHVLAAVIRRYVGGESARNKTLRPAAWQRNNVFLHHVLTGYLEGDGWYDGKNDRWRLRFTDNPWLVRTLRTICARLGYSCRIQRAPRVADIREQFAGTASHYHRGDIRLSPGPKVRVGGEIIGLRPSRRRRFYDIGVEGEPHLFALASGILTHNCRPNPPVGALADKVRPATSDMVIACTSRRRYFDLDSIRTQHARDYTNERPTKANREFDRSGAGRKTTIRDAVADPSGAPPLDHWWHDEDTFDQDAWLISTEPYKGSHYATWPSELCVKPIEAMCPRRVCRTCGKPSERVTRPTANYDSKRSGRDIYAEGGKGSGDRSVGMVGSIRPKGLVSAEYETLGWSDCGHDAWRPGVVLDPFAGSGTTGAVATGHGRDALLIDLDERNAELARQRVGMWLTVERFATETASGLTGVLKSTRGVHE